MNKQTLCPNELAQFTGTEYWYRHALARNVLYTDGVKYVAENAGAYWLVDRIALAQAEPKIARTPFQLWVLDVAADQRAALRCEDGNGEEVARQEIPFTDFPLAQIRFFYTNNVLHLPSEY